MRRKLFFVFLILLAFAGFASAQAGPVANDSEDAVVSVWISSVTWVNIDPDSLSYSGLTPGMETTASLEVSKYWAIEIENIGSQNITKLWANTTFETTRPWGSGDPTRYNAGNFILLTANSTDSNLYFVNRVEYNESDVLVYLKDPEGDMPVTGWVPGRFRNSSNEYFWMVQNPATLGRGCNESTSIRIGTVPHTRTQTGTVDFQAGPTTNVGLTTGTAPTANEWAIGSVTAGAAPGYCVAVKYDCSQVWFYHWNMDAPGATNAACTQAKYLNTATSRSVGSLAPGAYFASNVTLRIPYGVAQGNITGVLTIMASDT